MYSHAYIHNKVLQAEDHRLLAEGLSFLMGITLLGLLSHIAIPLPWTPVPITGQTFGVTLIALLWGQKRSFGIVAAYLIAGVIGAPVFALATGASWGYLVGMLLSTVVVGALSDRGWTNSFIKTYLAGACGSLIVFSCGVLGLSFVLPADQLLWAGVIPFLPGDFIKTVTAATIARRLNS